MGGNSWQLKGLVKISSTTEYPSAGQSMGGEQPTFAENIWAFISLQADWCAPWKKKRGLYLLPAFLGQSGAVEWPHQLLGSVLPEQIPSSSHFSPATPRRLLIFLVHSFQADYLHPPAGIPPMYCDLSLCSYHPRLLSTLQVQLLLRLTFLITKHLLHSLKLKLTCPFFAFLL